MRHIRARFLGASELEWNGEKIEFPYRQIDAVMIYLLMEHTVEQERLADLIWGDKFSRKGEDYQDKMRSNLRNAFYHIRKVFGKDFIRKLPGGRLTICQEYELWIDAIAFMEDSERFLELYQGEFLQGFYLKNNEAFTNWIEEYRRTCRTKYLEALHCAIEKTYENEDFELCRSWCEKLLKEDEFDELSYQYLIQIFQKRKAYSQALELYKQLERLFGEELFEKPSEEMQRLGREIQMARNTEILSLLEQKQKIEIEKHSFYGREKEIYYLTQALEDFQNILLAGEAGVGKSALAREVFSRFDDSNVWILKSYCFCEEESFLMKSWQGFMKQLLQKLEDNGMMEQHGYLVHAIYDLFPFLRLYGEKEENVLEEKSVDFESVQNQVIDAILYFSQAQPLIFYLDDVQWADAVSLNFIRNLITSPQTEQMMFWLSYRDDELSDAERLVSDLERMNLIKRIQLNCFDYNETIQFASFLAPKYPWSHQTKRILYQETEGNLLFITEMVHCIKEQGSLTTLTPNIHNLIKSRVEKLPREKRQILSLMSLFFDGISFTSLMELSQKDKFELIDILEDLMERKLIREIVETKDTYFCFNHQKILEYVYEGMSYTKQRILHNKVGQYLEDHLTKTARDVNLYPKLMYHFEKGKEQKKYLKYTVRYLSYYLNMAHEFFPVLEKQSISENQYDINLEFDNMEELEETLCGLSDKLEEVMTMEVRESQEDQEWLESMCDYFLMMGRYHIRKGEYEQGLKYTGLLRDTSRKLKAPLQKKYLIKANLRWISYYLNRCDLRHMKEMIDESYTLLEGDGTAEELAVWYRMDGYCFIMQGELEKGREKLQEAIDIYESSQFKEEYLYNLAASYAWMGEYLRLQKKYEEAQKYYRKALDNSPGSSKIGGISIFYGYSGISAYDSGDMKLAEHMLYAAMCTYQRANLIWGRGMTYAYYAQLQLKNKEYERGKELLLKAWEYASKLGSTYEKGIVCRICAQVINQFPGNPGLQECFENVLVQDTHYYVEKGQEYLADLFSPIDQEYLDEMSE